MHGVERKPHRGSDRRNNGDFRQTIRNVILNHQRGAGLPDLTLSTRKPVGADFTVRIPVTNSGLFDPDSKSFRAPVRDKMLHCLIDEPVPRARLNLHFSQRVRREVLWSGDDPTVELADVLKEGGARDNWMPWKPRPCEPKSASVRRS